MDIYIWIYKILYSLIYTLLFSCEFIPVALLFVCWLTSSFQRIACHNLMLSLPCVNCQLKPIILNIEPGFLSSVTCTTLNLTILIFIPFAIHSIQLNALANFYCWCYLTYSEYISKSAPD